jgi:hypothetical protein
MLDVQEATNNITEIFKYVLWVPYDDRTVQEATKMHVVGAIFLGIDGLS